jgi:hypothetical protein
VKRGKYPDTHEYAFELTLEINRALTFSPGEVTTLVLDALFALDKQGVLFPGVTSPEKRLRAASMEAVGYERSDDDAPADGAYRKLMSGSETPSKGEHGFTGRLWEAADAMIAAMLHQHMLVAKMHGLAEKRLYLAPITEADRASAEAFIAAAGAITASVEAAAKSAL